MIKYCSIIVAGAVLYLSSCDEFDRSNTSTEIELERDKQSNSQNAIIDQLKSAGLNEYQYIIKSALENAPRNKVNVMAAQISEDGDTLLHYLFQVKGFDSKLESKILDLAPDLADHKNSKLLTPLDILAGHTENITSDRLVPLFAHGVHADQKLRDGDTILHKVAYLKSSTDRDKTIVLLLSKNSRLLNSYGKDYKDAREVLFINKAVTSNLYKGIISEQEKRPNPELEEASEILRDEIQSQIRNNEHFRKINFEEILDTNEGYFLLFDSLKKLNNYEKIDHKSVPTILAILESKAGAIKDLSDYVESRRLRPTGKPSDQSPPSSKPNKGAPPKKSGDKPSHQPSTPEDHYQKVVSLLGGTNPSKYEIEKHITKITDINMTDADGDILLHKVAACKTLDVYSQGDLFKMLIDGGASPDIKNNQHKTALEVAVKNKLDKKLRRVLENYEPSKIREQLENINKLIEKRYSPIGADSFKLPASNDPESRGKLKKIKVMLDNKDSSVWTAENRQLIRDSDKIMFDVFIEADWDKKQFTVPVLLGLDSIIGDDDWFAQRDIIKPIKEYVKKKDIKTALTYFNDHAHEFTNNKVRDEVKNQLDTAINNSPDKIIKDTLVELESIKFIHQSSKTSADKIVHELKKKSVFGERDLSQFDKDSLPYKIKALIEVINIR